MLKDRKAADRKHSKKVYEKYKTERLEVEKMYGNKCFLCEKSHGRLHLHHKFYDEHSNYPRNGNGWSRILRIREAKQFPNKFYLLCPKCHNILTVIKQLGITHKHIDLCDV